MRIRTFTILGLILLVLPAATAAAAEGCLKCHARDDMSERGRKPALALAGGVHAKAGLDCSACHGGDATTDDFLKAHSKDAGFHGRPGPGEIPSVCGACHDDAARMSELGATDLPIGQAKMFAASVHGTVDPVEGYERPSCISCHGVHGIKAPSDPESPAYVANVPATCDRCHGDLGYMRAFTSARVRTNQLDEYVTSVHGQRLAEGDLKVAVCSSCHGSHDILPGSNPNSRVHATNVETTCGNCHADPKHMAGYTVPKPSGGERPLPTDQLAKYRKSVHANAIHEKGDLSAPTCNDCHGNHGATPPEIRVVANVCSQCHSRPAELYSQGPLKDTISAAGFPACATCHGHHEILPPGDDLLGSIARGRTPSGWSPGAEERTVAAAYLEGIDGLEARLAEVTGKIETAENFGMDVTRARLKLTQAHDKLIQAKVTVHAFSRKALAAVTEGTEDEEGGLSLLARASELADASLEEREFRRQGLVVALAIILFLMVALVLKIRRMESGNPAE